MKDIKRLIGVAKETLTAGPSTIYLDLTTACGINCNFCWIHSYHNPTRPLKMHLPLESIYHIMDQAHEWGTSEVMLSGDGEPTLHPQFKEIIDCIKSKNISIFLASNGTFSTKLLSTVAKIDRIYVNFSAPNQELYTKIISPQNPKNFGYLMKNMKALSVLSRRHKKPYLMSAYIINNTNYHCITEMIDILEGLAVHEVTFRMMEPTENTKQLLLSPEQKNELLNSMRTLLKRKLTIDNNLAAFTAELEGSAASPFKIKHCYTGWYNVFVDFNLNVGVCCHNENLVMGSLKTSTLKEIWESMAAHKMRLMCKNDFDINKAPFKGECEWCHWSQENQTIDKDLAQLISLTRH